MKNLLFFFVFFSLRLFAQTNVYHPFPDSNAVWNVNKSAGCFGVGSSNYSIIISGDTLISGKTYHKLNVPYVQIVVPCGSKTGGYQGAIRQDVSNKKVFFVPPFNSTEQLLYDFTLQVGDTVKGYIGQTNTPSWPDVIQSIDSVLVGSNYRKRWKTDSYYNPYIIEGIGSLYGVVERFPGKVTDMPWYSITCFKQNGATLYPATSTNCALIVTSVNDIGENSSQVKISPNPSSGVFSIQSETPMAIGSEINNVEIYNVLGEIVYTDNINSAKAVINLEDKNKGVYFYRIVSSDKKITSGKLIIQ